MPRSCQVYRQQRVESLLKKFPAVPIPNVDPRQRKYVLSMAQSGGDTRCSCCRFHNSTLGGVLWLLGGLLWARVHRFLTLKAADDVLSKMVGTASASPVPVGGSTWFP